MRVCINARLTGGVSGGIESVVIGLAYGLSALADGDDEYLFLVHDDAYDWLAGYLANACRPVRIGANGHSARARARIRARHPTLRRAIGVQAARWASPVRPSDGTAEGLGAAVVHFPFQAGFLTSIPTIFQPHDLQHLHLPENFTGSERIARDRTYRTLCGEAAAVAVGTRWVKDDLITHYGLPASAIHVIALAPMYEVYADAAPTAVPKPGAGDFLLYPAQTWPHKNHVGLLRALALLRDRHDLVVPLVATGRKTDYFERTIRPVIDELRLDDQVDFRGFVETDELRRLHEDARAVVVPTTFEAASFPVWDAFLSGVPVACSAVTSLPEQVGDAAILFDPSDLPDMANAIRRIWLDDRLRRELVAKGKTRVERLSWKETARRFRALYRYVAKVPLDASDAALLGEEPVL